MNHCKIRFKLKGRKVLNFVRHEDGATAIEFAILALPFFVLLFGILELAVVFFIQSNVQNAAFEIARQVRTGEFTGSENQLKNGLCREMNPGIQDSELAACRAKFTEVKVTPLGDFSNSTSFAPAAPAADPNDPPPPNVQTTQGGDTVLMEVTYRYELALPGTLSRMSNTNAGNYRDIKIATAFRNEPF